MERRGKDGDSHHWDLTQVERRVLEAVADGSTDNEIATVTDSSVRAVQSTIRRFRDRTGLAGRRLVIWAADHRGCCISISKSI